MSLVEIACLLKIRINARLYVNICYNITFSLNPCILLINKKGTSQPSSDANDSNLCFFISSLYILLIALSVVAAFELPPPNPDPRGICFNSISRPIFFWDIFF